MEAAKIGLCKPPDLKHKTDILIITMFVYCKSCDKYIEFREAISLHEMKQFVAGGKELRSFKIEKLFEKVSEIVNIGGE
jgi:hypothetical protein